MKNSTEELLKQQAREVVRKWPPLTDKQLRNISSALLASKRRQLAVA